jgi:hypothetical protein
MFFRTQWVIAPDTTIQCGIDGDVRNNCTLVDGFFHVLFMSAVPGLDGYAFGTGQDEVALLYDADLSLDNVTIKGMTFTGTMESDGTFDVSSVAISQRGNVTFEDCLWTDIISSHGLVGVYINLYQIALGQLVVPPKTSQLNIVRSTFHNIIYDGYVLLPDMVMLLVLSVVSRVALCLSACLFVCLFVCFTTFLAHAVASLDPNTRRKCDTRNTGRFYSISSNHYTSMIVHLRTFR